MKENESRSKSRVRKSVTVLLTVFFAIGGLINIIAPGRIADEFLEWGYPSWFHFLTGSLEIVTAVLLVRSKTRFLGVILGALVMLAAAATVLMHHLTSRVVPPTTVFALLVLLGWLLRGKRIDEH